MGRWPPIIWLLVSLGSLLVLIGVGGDWNPVAFVAGAGAVVLGLLLALYLAYGRHRDRPRARGLNWLVGGTVAFYLVCVALTAFAGGKYVLAAVGAALVPLTAAALIVATTRVKTVAGADGRRETTAHADDDPLPGIGIDDATPLGDTDQHSDAAA
jgi:drug/metabolite transporter (DMT)-like permease